MKRLFLCELRDLDTMSSKEEKDEKKMEKVEEEIVSKEEAEKMKELRRRVQGLADDNEYVKSNLTDQAIVRRNLHTHNTSLSKIFKLIT